MVRRIVKEALNSLVADLRATHGTNLASIVLYGSAAAGDHVELRSDYNLLIALTRITPEDLRQAQAPMREWQRLGHPLPVYFTVEELADAADVFPIEFHQMANARVVLFGKDPFERIFDLRATGVRPASEQEANDLFAAYMVQIEHVIVAVDNLDTDAKQKTAVT